MSRKKRNWKVGKNLQTRMELADGRVAIIDKGLSCRKGFVMAAIENGKFQPISTKKLVKEVRPV